MYITPISNINLEESGIPIKITWKLRELMVKLKIYYLII